MSSLANPPVRRRLRALLALAGAALASTALASSASAAPATGELVLTLKKGAQSSLLREGVSVSPRSGKGATQTVKLPVADLDFAGPTRALTGATLTLSAKGKKAKLAAVALQVGAKSTSISAKLAGKRTVFFVARGKASVDGLSVGLDAPLSLTGKGTKALRKALGLDGITAGKLGTAALSAAVDELKPAPTAPEKPKAPEEKEVPKEPYPYEAQCPVPAVEGNPGFGEPPGKIESTQPLPSFNAGTSQAVTGGDAEWGFKDSFRSYVLFVPPAGTLQALDGATGNPVGPNMGTPGSFWSFPSSEGTYEPGTTPDHSDDKLVLDGGGTVLFCKPGHGFNIVLKNPTVVLDGESSRIVADVGANFNGTWYPLQRADIADIDLSAVEPKLTNGGNTITWEDVPVELSADGEKALGAIYPAGEDLDPITVEASLDRPLTSECAIAAGTVETPPAVNFALTPLPTLSSPVVRSGENLGTINWGFRRGTRNSTVLGGGSFPLLGGATASYPGNMGGAAGAPPTGGNGKFFRFPISSYSYEAGTADPKDDRLIATSDATVAFCNPGQGNFGAVLSKPTLIIDGTNSRIVANAYSFSGEFMSSPADGWIGGRVELVDLDTSAIDAVTAGDTVSWGEIVPDETPLNSGIPVEGALKTDALSLAGLVPAGTASNWDPVAAQIALPPAP